MADRTREWMKFGVLLALALILALIFAQAVDFPRASAAQQRPVALHVGEQPAVRASEAAIALGDAFAQVAEAVRPAVVFIQAERRSEPSGRQLRPQLPPPFDEFFRFPDEQEPRIRRGQGSGFIISEDGYILTNNHVVEGAERLRVRLLDRREFSAKVVGRDPDTDVAVIKIDGTGLHPVTFGNSDELRIGEWVLAIGNPLGEDFSFTVTAGIVSAKGRLLRGLEQPDRSYRIHDFIQTDAAINPGNSGGPLVNVHGQVVGINSAIASPTGFFQGYGFAVPINLARTVAEQLIAHGRVTRAILGIAIRAVEPEDAAYVGMDSIRGVVVEDFSIPDSPAKEAGIQPGDVIVEVDGQPIEYVAQLQQLVGFKRPGDRVRVTLVRKGGERRTFTVRLAAREEDRSAVAQAGGEEGDKRPPYQEKLGLSVEPLPREVAAREGLTDEQIGLLITGVDPDGPAADKAIGPQQIITHVNGQRVRTVSDLEAALENVKPGDVVSLRVYRPQVNSFGVVRLKAGGQ